MVWSSQIAAEVLALSSAGCLVVQGVGVSNLHRAESKICSETLELFHRENGNVASLSGRKPSAVL